MIHARRAGEDAPRRSALRITSSLFAMTAIDPSTNWLDGLTLEEIDRLLVAPKGLEQAEPAGRQLVRP